MTSKERIVTALKNGQPDAVPVTLGLSEMVPVRKSGLTYIEFFWREKRDINKTRTDVERQFGAEVFIHSAAGPSPHDPEITTEALAESPEEVVYKETIHTGKGDLESIKRLTRTESIAIKKGFVDDPEKDYEKVMELLKHPDTADFSQVVDHWNYVGDDGHCGYWAATPIDWWSILRRSPENTMYDFMDYPEIMERIFAAYTEYTVELLKALLERYRPYVDSLGVGGSSTSMSVMSPEYLQQYTVPFVRAIKPLCRAHDLPIQYHMCGRSRQAIPILVEAGVDGMDALESPPTGNVDLAEVKRLFGDKISLRGNVNSITVLLNGKPEDVERDVIRCIESAKPGGGFILGVGDQAPYWTPDENIFALVETGRRYAKYE